MLPCKINSSSLKAVSRLSSLSATIRPYSTMSSNLTLYSWATPNGIKASITLEELGLPYNLEKIDISTNVQKEEYGTYHLFLEDCSTNNTPQTDGS